ncbi:hypothetical protein JZ751_007573 [Albula glossodonta]|uniref:Uncharacterized protein n=1 Tax=Albula glossodonta TaxID=121402 RepID=A0A8T2N511_9TELE|nr:hypothetical protein JZ751_007573 [Albula glossodonta]
MELWLGGGAGQPPGSLLCRSGRLPVQSPFQDSVPLQGSRARTVRSSHSGQTGGRRENHSRIQWEGGRGTGGAELTPGAAFQLRCSSLKNVAPGGLQGPGPVCSPGPSAVQLRDAVLGPGWSLTVLGGGAWLGTCLLLRRGLAQYASKCCRSQPRRQHCSTMPFPFSRGPPRPPATFPGETAPQPDQSRHRLPLPHSTTKPLSPQTNSRSATSSRPQRAFTDSALYGRATRHRSGKSYARYALCSLEHGGLEKAVHRAQSPVWEGSSRSPERINSTHAQACLPLASQLPLHRCSAAGPDHSLTQSYCSSAQQI